MPATMSGSLIRATPPCARMSAGTRSSAMTATAPASSAILAWSAVTTSMITPPLSISAIPRFTRAVPVVVSDSAGLDDSTCGLVGADTALAPQRMTSPADRRTTVHGDHAPRWFSRAVTDGNGRATSAILLGRPGRNTAFVVGQEAPIDAVGGTSATQLLPGLNGAG